MTHEPSESAATAYPGATGLSRVNDLADRLAGVLGTGRKRILSLGAGASPLAHELARRGHEILEPGPDPASDRLAAIATSSAGAFDAVLAFGFVERERWDRWTLQRIQRALKKDGVLLLAVPDLYSPRSLVSPRYVVAKLAKILPRLGARGRLPVSPAREAMRSYPARRLRATLERLDFEPLRWSRIGMAPGEGLAGGTIWPPTHHLVLARKRAAVEFDAGTFEDEHRAFLATRERWRAEIMPAGEPTRVLEPERCAGARVLVLAPHPDDELVGCGGTLLRLVNAGAKVIVLQATDGSASAALEEAPAEVVRTIRLEEARAVARAAGFEGSIFWGEDNRAFRVRDDLVARLRDTLHELRPALVFTPFVADIHPDHRTLNQILARALESLPDVEAQVLGYEVWSLAPVNLWCDVSAASAELERLLLLYETAMKVDDLIRMCATRNRWHASTLENGAASVEAFFATTPGRFCELAERAARAAPPH